MTDHTSENSAPRNPYAGAYPGNLFMVVAPSGAGKSTLVNALLARDEAIRLSISYTTRPPRPKEKDGEHYHFTTVDDFLKRHATGEFLESAEVHGNYYATSRLWIEEQMKSGHDVLLEIDWQGAQQVKKQFRNAVEIFILPPSLEALEDRLKKRGQDEPNVITRRLLAAAREIGSSRIRRRMPPRAYWPLVTLCPANASCAVIWPAVSENTLVSSPSTADGMQSGSQE